MFTKERIVNALSQYRRNECSLNEFTGFTKAAVLVPLFPTADGLSVLLTLRTDDVEAHKGQVSFPGGTQDTSDKNSIDTALRESQEELGLEPHAVEILGLLDDRPVPTQFIITPVVGYMTEPPVCTLYPPEVAEVFNAPLSFFADESNGTSEERELHNRKFRVWHFQYEQYHIWGATAAIIRNLIDVTNPFQKIRSRP